MLDGWSESDTHHALDDGDGFRVGLNPSYDLPDGLIDLPDGQISENRVQPPLQKYFCFSETQIKLYVRRPVPQRGAARDRHGRGAGCGGRKWRYRRGRFLADGEVVWS